jgi:diguanylate cyclase (GGDEF)-like protein
MRGPSFYGGKRARNRTGVPLVRDLLTARGFEPESNCHVDTIQKQRGLALATSGLAVAIGVIALLNALRFAQVTPREWVVTALACCVTVGGLWLLLRSGERLWRGWDPHFVLVPTLAVTLLLSELAWAAAEARLMVLVVWPVVLLFLAGYVGFGTGALMSALMTAGYLAAVVLAEPPGTRIGVELVLALVFLVTSLFGCVVLGRIRHQRLALAAARADLARLVNTDPLTELPNRRQFATVFGAEVARVERYGGSFSLGVLDCDNFKSYNDSHGHPAGDEALVELAGLLREQLRASDSVARLGGEEFAVLLVGVDKATAARVAERIRRRVAGHGFGAGGHALTVSIGIATAPEDAHDADELFRLADQALYAAKAQGRNRIALAEPEAATVPIG